ncbi:MAG: hypothetical protein RL259_588 [Bacteroidota bacterium]|jgi:hypothetical protein
MEFRKTFYFDFKVRSNKTNEKIEEQCINVCQFLYKRYNLDYQIHDIFCGYNGANDFLNNKKTLRITFYQ